MEGVLCVLALVDFLLYNSIKPPRDNRDETELYP